MLNYKYNNNSFKIYNDENLKIFVPELIFYDINRLNFTDSRCYKANNNFYLVNLGMKRSIFSEGEFNFNLFNIIKQCKCTPIGADFINLFNADLEDGSLIKEINKNTRSGVISDCLFYNIYPSASRPFSSEYNYLFFQGRGDTEVMEPASSYLAIVNRYENGAPIIEHIKQESKNFSLPWEYLTRAPQDKKEVNAILNALHRVSNGERLEYTNLILDYILAMLFKYNAFHKELDWQLFPILLVTGTKASGKSTLVKTLCNFFWNKEDDFFYNSSKLEGANVLTRFHNLHALNVLPIVLDDLQDISSYITMINPTLTQGFITEEIGSSGGKNITRKMFNTLIITANNINIMQSGGSDAAVDRFIELNIIEQPLTSIESKKNFQNLMSYSASFWKVGNLILNIIKKNTKTLTERIDYPDYVWNFDNRKSDFLKMLLFGDRIRRVVMSEINGQDGCFTEELNFEKYFLGVKHKTNITKNSDVIHDALLSLMNENIYIQGKYYNLKQFIVSEEYLSGSQTLIQQDDIFNQILSNLGLYQATASKTEFGESGQFVTTGLFIKRIKDNINRNNHKQFTITTDMLAKELPQYFEKLVSVNYYQKSQKTLANKKLASYTLRFNAMQFLIDNQLIDDDTVAIVKSFGKYGSD